MERGLGRLLHFHLHLIPHQVRLEVGAEVLDKISQHSARLGRARAYLIEAVIGTCIYIKCGLDSGILQCLSLIHI